MSLNACSPTEPGANLAVVRQGLAPARASSKPNKATDAALRYLLTRDPDSLDHLRAILFKAKGNLYLIDNGLSLSQATRVFMKAWLNAKLAHYCAADPDEIYAAARRDEFRYLGRQFRFALIDEIRRRTSRRAGREMRVGDDLISHHSPLGAELEAVLCERRPEITALLGEKLYQALVAVCRLDRLDRKGDVARAIAVELGVSVQTGRKWLRRLCARLGGGVRSSPVRSLCALLGLQSSYNDADEK